jgi:hypothetical protein
MAYCSWRAVELDDDEIVWMAQNAQGRNIALGVTSALFLFEGQLLQIMEGPRGPLAWLYDYIASDPRHLRVVKIQDEPVERRAFDGWSLRLLSPGDLRSAELSAVRRSLAWADRLADVGEVALSPEDFADCRAALAASAARRGAPPSSSLHS